MPHPLPFHSFSHEAAAWSRVVFYTLLEALVAARRLRLSFGLCTMFCFKGRERFEFKLELRQKTFTQLFAAVVMGAFVMRQRD